MDAHYVEDFLLMYRVFIQDPTMIFEKLMHWFAESNHRDKVHFCFLLFEFSVASYDFVKCG